MANIKVGTVVYWCNSSSVLAVFRMMPESGSTFVNYKGGQYMALRRENCRLTKKVVGADGKVDYVLDLDEHGNPKRGPVTHSYSIASAPFETLEKGHLEFYVILEKDEKGSPGRLTESLFRMDPQQDNKLLYFDRITGDFTLDKRAAGFKNVVLVGTGTGLAPFVSMVKQLHFEAGQGKNDGVKYTLVHANRTFEELDYYDELSAIEAAQKFDFLYVPSVSRPTARDYDNPKISKGRATNLLRYFFEMPLKEEQALQEAVAKGDDAAKLRAVLERTVRPVLAAHLSRNALQQRMDPPHTVLLSCGNPSGMADIKYVAETNGIRFEKEDW
jgi:ferredoxin-NADP reductase